MITTRVPAYSPPDPPPPPPAHDLASPLGGPCEGCQPAADQHPRRYLILAARNAFGADHACGHYHAEHVTDDLDAAYDILRALLTLHASAEIVNVPTGSLITNTSHGDHRDDAAPCCQRVAGPFGPSTEPGARCRYCGDPWTLWTKATQ